MSDLNILYRGSQSVPLTHTQLNNNLLELVNKKVAIAGSVALFTAGTDATRGIPGTYTTANGNLRINTTSNTMEWYKNVPGNTGWESHSSTGYKGSSAAGYNGSVGYTGSIGYTGSVGSRGSTGGIGPTGPIGYTGSRGSQGLPGTNNTTRGSTGSPGYTGSFPSNTALAVQGNISRSNYKSLIIGQYTSLYPGSGNLDSGVCISGLGYVSSGTKISSYPNLSLHRSIANASVLTRVIHFRINSSTISEWAFNQNIGGSYYPGFRAVSGQVTFAPSSDYRRKTNLKLQTDLLSKLAKINIYNFNYIGTPNKQTGFIAHELQEYFPCAVTGKKDEIDVKGEPIYQMLSTLELIPILIASVKELSIKAEKIKAWLK